MIAGLIVTIVALGPVAYQQSWGRVAVTIAVAGILIPGIFLWLLIALMNWRYGRQIARGEEIRGFNIWMTLLLLVLFLAAFFSCSWLASALLAA